MSKIIEHHSNGKRWLIVEVSKSATDISLDVGCRIRYMDSEECVVMLPFGNYRLHCVAEEAGSREADKVVEYIVNMKDNYWFYKDYVSGLFCKEWPKQSLKSLITHHFGTTGNKHVILEIL